MIKSLKVTKIINLIALVLLIGVFSGCSNKNIETNKQVPTAPPKASFSNISPEEAKKRIDGEKNVILLDVRTKEEYETGHIKNSILIPVDNLKEEAEKKLKDKASPIFIYCRSGNRSVTAANILIELGYKNVYNLGGIKDWPYEIITTLN
jgi:phage shock protein E